METFSARAAVPPKWSSAHVLPAGIHQHPEGASFPQLLHENGVAVAYVDKMQSQHGLTCAG